MYTQIEKALLDGLNEAESILKEIGGFLNRNSAVILEGFRRFIVLIARLFAGALVIEALAGMNPALREMIPSLYRINDILLLMLEKVCAEDLKFLGF